MPSSSKLWQLMLYGSFDLPKSGVSDWLCYVSQAFVSSRKDQKTLTWEDAAFCERCLNDGILCEVVLMRQFLGHFTRLAVELLQMAL